MTLKNLPLENAEKLADLITPKHNQIVSMALSKSDNVQVTLFTFADRETVSEEEYFGDTMYYVVEGETYVVLKGKKVLLQAGDVFSVPSRTLHEIGGKGAFKVLQITVNE